MLWISKDSSFTAPPICEPHLRILKTYEAYRYIEAMFQDFEAWEVIELCEDYDIPRVDAVVLTQCWLLANGRDDEFEINCAEAERFFLKNGWIDVPAYLEFRPRYCVQCGDQITSYPRSSESPYDCAICSEFAEMNAALKEIHRNA